MIGIIAEYNPFHYGHLHHLDEVKKMFPGKTICLILAGHFLNRGEVSVVNKWDKTKVALEYGVDLVVELPFKFSSQAADFYAFGAISILDKLKCEYIVFGSECGDIEYLKKLALVKNNDISLHLKKGYSYPKALSLSSSEYVSSPNDILGVCYIKVINNLKSNIVPVCIKRTNDYHSLELNNKITSASSIRKGLRDKKDISSFVPSDKYIKNLDMDELFYILKHRIIFDDIFNIQTIDGNLGYSLKKHILNSNSIDELISLVKSKNITYNKIKRSLVHILVNFKKDDFLNEVNYIRILGFNSIGRNYLNSIKKSVDVPIYSKFCSDMQLEYNATIIYSLLTKDDILQKEKETFIII